LIITLTFFYLYKFIIKTVLNLYICMMGLSFSTQTKFTMQPYFTLKIASYTISLTCTNAKFKPNIALDFIFAYGCTNLEVSFIHSRFQNLEGYFYISLKLSNSYIHKWVMSSGFSYLEWCTVNSVEDWDLELIYICLWILTFGRSFMLFR